MNKTLTLLALICFLLFFNSCEEPENTVKPAIITFINASGFYVDLYKNINPSHYEPSALVYIFAPAETKQIEFYPSFDQVLGDAFFPQYKIRLADFLQTGTVDIFASAQSLINLTFIIKSGDRNTISIPEPNHNELLFNHAYIIVKNYNRVPIQIIRGTNVLERMDNKSVILNPGDTGYYEIKFTHFDTDINLNHLFAFNNQNILFPSFSAERGKKYTFTVGETISNPLIENIL